MTRTEALRTLAAKVEAGEKYATMGHTSLCSKAFPKPDDFDGSREAFAKSDAQMAILAWRNGSLDAAKALHDAVLPGWDVWYETSLGVSMKPKDNRIWQNPIKFTDNPARAWLLAIIKALIAEERAGALQDLADADRDLI